MRLRHLRQAGILIVPAVLMTGCAFAGGMTDSEKDMISDMTPSRYQPATRDIRNNIETQDNFAQAAFWSREYQLNPADLEAAIKLSAAVRRMGNPGKAVEIAQTSRALYPKDPYLTAEYAAALIASERSDDAIKALDDGLRTAPTYARLWSLKGAALDQLENYDLARRHYDRALQITPNDPNIMSNLGLSYALAGDPATAETWLRRAMAQPGAGANIRQTLDLILQIQGKSASAAGTPSPALNSPQQGQPAQSPYQQRPQYSAQPQYQPPAQQPRVYGQTSPDAPQGYSSYKAPVPSQVQSQSAYQSPAQPSAAPRTSLPLRTMNSSQNYAPSAATNTAPAYRANVSVNPGDDGGPKTAADAARAAAAQSQGQPRRVIVPANEAPPSAEQRNILDQIAQNIGPRSNPSAVPPRYSERYAPENMQRPAPQNGGYPPAAYQGYAPQPYAANTAKQEPNRRAPARRR